MVNASFADIVIAMLAAFGLAGVLCLMAVGLGAFAMFRAKRDSHESFFQVRQPQGAVGSLDEPFAVPDAGGDPVASMFKELEKDNLRFLKQYGARKENAEGE